MYNIALITKLEDCVKRSLCAASAPVCPEPVLLNRSFSANEKAVEQERMAFYTGCGKLSIAP